MTRRTALATTLATLAAAVAIFAPIGSPVAQADGACLQGMTRVPLGFVFTNTTGEGLCTTGTTPVITVGTPYRLSGTSTVRTPYTIKLTTLDYAVDKQCARVTMYVNLEDGYGSAAAQQLVGRTENNCTLVYSGGFQDHVLTYNSDQSLLADRTQRLRPSFFTAELCATNTSGGTLFNSVKLADGTVVSRKACRNIPVLINHPDTDVRCTTTLSDPLGLVSSKTSGVGMCSSTGTIVTRGLTAGSFKASVTVADLVTDSQCARVWASITYTDTYQATAGKTAPVASANNCTGGRTNVALNMSTQSPYQYTTVRLCVTYASGTPVTYSVVAANGTITYRAACKDIPVKLG